MNELLFLIIGLFLGYLMGIISPCLFYLRKVENENKSNAKKL